MHNPFRYFNSSPEVIRLAVMMYIRYPLSLRQVEDLLFERGIDICHESVRFWWNRFGPMFATEIRKRRIHHRSFSQWPWHLDEVFVRISGVTSSRKRLQSASNFSERSIPSWAGAWASCPATIAGSPGTSRGRPWNWGFVDG